MDEIDKKRFYSHIFQIYSVFDLEPQKVLEIGTGDGFVSNVLQKHFFTTTLDIDIEKFPDWFVDISDLSKLDEIPDDFFDVILICEVLEHIPYEKIEGVLEVLKKKTKKNLILSVPDQTKHLNLNLSVHGFSELKRNILLKTVKWFIRVFNRGTNWVSKCQYKLINKKRTYISLADGEHYWELGVDRYSVSEFRNLLKKYFKIIHEERVKEFPWHHFFILEKIIDGNNE